MMVQSARRLPGCRKAHEGELRALACAVHARPCIALPDSGPDRSSAARLPGGPRVSCAPSHALPARVAIPRPPRPGSRAAQLPCCRAAWTLACQGAHAGGSPPSRALPTPCRAQAAVCPVQLRKAGLPETGQAEQRAACQLSRLAHARSRRHQGACLGPGLRCLARAAAAMAAGAVHWRGLLRSACHPGPPMDQEALHPAAGPGTACRPGPAVDQGSAPQTLGGPLHPAVGTVRMRWTSAPPAGQR